MAKLKPWHKVVTPREDLRDGKPLDASEFALRLDEIRKGKEAADYNNPVRFCERTFLTKNLHDLASQVVRRLSREKTATSAVFNMATQFGGEKEDLAWTITLKHGRKRSDEKQLGKTY